MTDSRQTVLRALGFCGADDSVNPKFLAIISNSYPSVEFGVLFRPDKEGQPRYASQAWVDRLKQVVGTNPKFKMKLAAHFCSSRVNEVLSGNDNFLLTLRDTFQRVQINATAVNGVDMSMLDKGNVQETIAKFSALVNRHPELEFILQKNDETRPLWEGMLNLGNETCGPVGGLPQNVTMLVDESKGTGISRTTAWPSPPEEYDIGYAGGIGPKNIEKVLADVILAGNGRKIWIDMESSLRSSKNGGDVFDLDKCFEVIEATCAAGLLSHPNYLPT